MAQTQTLTLARHAMATRFEIVLHGQDSVSLRAAGEEALDEVERLESRLSLFRPDSEIAHINARAAREPVRVTPEVFSLLARAAKLSEETAGAFDITIAPLVRCWGFIGGTGRIPKAPALAQARAMVGMHLVRLDAENYTVQFARPGVMLDLGAIGKGYAVERAAEILRDGGVGSALVHGGTSTICAVGSPPGSKAWVVAIEDPRERLGPGAAGKQVSVDTPGDEAPGSLIPVALRDEAMSVSAVWGKCFEAQGRLLGHVLDPRSGTPATGAVLAAVVAPSATETDALSTALLVLGVEGHSQVACLRPGIRTMVVGERGGKLRAKAQGIELPGGKWSED